MRRAAAPRTARPLPDSCHVIRSAPADSRQLVRAAAPGPGTNTRSRWPRHSKNPAEEYADPIQCFARRWKSSCARHYQSERHEEGVDDNVRRTWLWKAGADCAALGTFVMLWMERQSTS